MIVSTTTITRCGMTLGSERMDWRREEMHRRGETHKGVQSKHHGLFFGTGDILSPMFLGEIVTSICEVFHNVRRPTLSRSL